MTKAKIIIRPKAGQGYIGVNLTDGLSIWGDRKFRNPDRAIAYIHELMEEGHIVVQPEMLQHLRKENQG